MDITNHEVSDFFFLLRTSDKKPVQKRDCHISVTGVREYIDYRLLLY